MASENQVLDITADVCPYTLIKSQLKVEELAPGEVLEIHLGNSESAANVPRTLDLEGHEILSVEKQSAARWIVSVKKG